MMCKKKTLSLLVGLIGTTASFSQQHKAFYYVGLATLKPAYLRVNGEDMSFTGIGIEFQREQFFMKKFSWTINAGYAAFWGKYNFYRYHTSPLVEITINQYSSIPISTGLRFHWRQFNLGFEGGAMIGVDKNSGKCPFVAPSIGYKINKDGTHSFDLNLRLLNTLDFGSADENSLVSGGYGMWELRLAYRFLRAGSKE